MVVTVGLADCNHNNTSSAQRALHGPPDLQPQSAGHAQDSPQQQLPAVVFLLPQEEQVQEGPQEQESPHLQPPSQQVLAAPQHPGLDLQAQSASQVQFPPHSHFSPQDVISYHDPKP